jgi:hypothetical protein
MAAPAGNPINFPDSAIPFAYRGVGANPRMASYPRMMCKGIDVRSSTVNADLDAAIA